MCCRRSRLLIIFLQKEHSFLAEGTFSRFGVGMLILVPTGSLWRHPWLFVCSCFSSSGLALLISSRPRAQRLASATWNVLSDMLFLTIQTSAGHAVLFSVVFSVVSICVDIDVSVEVVDEGLLMDMDCFDVSPLDTGGVSNFESHCSIGGYLRFQLLQYCSTTFDDLPLTCRLIVPNASGWTLSPL